MSAPTRSVTPEPLSERAYVALRDRIVDLRLPPGATLREDELMREMGIGRTPLREALKRLALEHLVEVRPRRGTSVTDVRADDIARFAEVRAQLEAHAARLAAERMDDEMREECEALAADLRATDRDDAIALMRVDERLHSLVWRAARNAYLESTLEGYFALSLRVRHVVLDRVAARPQAAEEHERLLAALLAGDGRGAETVMREHVTGSARHVLDAL